MIKLIYTILLGVGLLLALGALWVCVKELIETSNEIQKPKQNRLPNWYEKHLVII